MNKKAEVVKQSEKIISTIDKKFNIPSIIRLIKIVRAIYKNEVPFTKKNVFIRDEYICQYCGKNTKQKYNQKCNDSATVDHIIPQSKGGKSSWDNCVCACKECNNKKADKLPSEVKMSLRKKPTHPTISEFIKLRLKSTGIDEIINNIWSN